MNEHVFLYTVQWILKNSQGNITEFKRSGVVRVELKKYYFTLFFDDFSPIAADTFYFEDGEHLIDFHMTIEK